MCCLLVGAHGIGRIVAARSGLGISLLRLANCFFVGAAVLVCCVVAFLVVSLVLSALWHPCGFASVGVVGQLGGAWLWCLGADLLVVLAFR